MGQCRAISLLAPVSAVFATTDLIYTHEVTTQTTRVTRRDYPSTDAMLIAALTSA